MQTQELKDALRVLESYDGTNGEKVIAEALEIITAFRKELEGE